MGEPSARPLVHAEGHLLAEAQARLCDIEEALVALGHKVAVSEGIGHWWPVGSLCSIAREVRLGRIGWLGTGWHRCLAHCRSAGQIVDVDPGRSICPP